MVCVLLLLLLVVAVAAVVVEVAEGVDLIVVVTSSVYLVPGLVAATANAPSLNSDLNLLIGEKLLQPLRLLLWLWLLNRQEVEEHLRSC